MPMSKEVKLRISLYTGPGGRDRPFRDLLLDYDGHQGYNNYHYSQIKNVLYGKAENILVDQPKIPDSTAFRIRMPAVKILDLTHSSQAYSVTCGGKSEDVLDLTALLALPGAMYQLLSKDDNEHLIEIPDEYNHFVWFTSIRCASGFPVAQRQTARRLRSSHPSIQ